MNYDEDHHIFIANLVNYDDFLKFILHKDVISSIEMIEFLNLNKYFEDNKTDIQMLCDIIIGISSTKSNFFQWKWIFHKNENKGNYPDYELIWHEEN